MARQQPEGWHPEDIKAALRKAHGPLTRLSVHWGYHRSAISAAVVGQKRWPALQRRIAKALGLAPHTLWPDRFARSGESIRGPVIARDASRAPRRPHRQKGIAA